MNEIINNSRIILEQIHFIRADWFYAFIPLLLFLLLASRKKPGNKNWAPIIDAQLMPFVLSTSNDSKQRRYPLLLSFISCSLCITALAGPVYKKLAQPVYREQSSLVVILDLSQSMNASDLKPSRLTRAKLELLDILKTRKTGQTALIVYAADAFVVTPLTDDNTTIANLIPALETDMMPAQGSRLSIALSKSLSLFEQAGVIRGDILLITDGIHARDENAIKKITSQGHRLSIFGIGTSAGAPIPVEGGFLKDSNGAIVIPRLDVAKLQRYALTGNGLYTDIRADDSDIEKLSRLFQSSSIEKNTDEKKLNADIWQEEGYWLLLPLLFFAALWSRRGWLAVIIPFALPALLLITSLHSQPAYADTDTNTENIKPTPLIDSENLWFSPDQKAMKAFQQGKNENAAKQFNNPDWKASAYYRSRNYQAVVETLKNSQHQEAYYNKANALAKLGQYKEALQAYDKAIELNSQNLNSNNEDAKYNREQVKQALENQQQKNQDQDQQPDNKDSQEDQENSENKEQQDSDDKQSDKKDSDDKGDKKGDKSQPQDSENTEQQPDQKAEKKSDEQAEQQQLEQRNAEAEKEQQQQEKSDYEQQQKEHEQKTQESEQIENTDSEEKPMEIEVNPTEASISEDERATEQWLKRIPDDPGGLLRRKFYYQYKRVPNQNDEIEPW